MKVGPFGALGRHGGTALDREVAACVALAVAQPNDLALAWELARRVPETRSELAFALVLAVANAAREGSTLLGPRGRAAAVASLSRLGVSEPLARRAGRLLSGVPESPSDDGPQLLLGFEAPASIETILAGLPLRVEPLALERHLRSEQAIADELGRRARLTETEVVELALPPLETPRGRLALTDEQRAAVLAGSKHRTLVITGGPGTGKTSIVVELLRARAHRDGPSSLAGVALCAPTGKAADRMGQAVRGVLEAHLARHPADSVEAAMLAHLRAPSTVHRLLGFRPDEGRFAAGEGQPLVERLIVVDEASMVESSLFERLLAALHPDATLILLGDPDQLPSVGAGAVLADLVAVGAPVPIARLTHSHRMDPTNPGGAHVLAVARACLEDDPRPPFREVSLERFRPGSAGASWIPSDSGRDEDLEGLLVRWLDHARPPALFGPLANPQDTRGATPEAVRRALGHAASTRLLAVTRADVARLDAFLGQRASSERGHLRPGDPVLVVKNDANEELWNGDSGLVFRDHRGDLTVAFDRGASVVLKPLRTVEHLLERAYAMTVHKAQGSEADSVVLVLPPSESPLVTREILYTALTRARTSAAVLGSRRILALALAQRTERETWLRHALASAVGSSPASTGAGRDLAGRVPV